MLTAVVRVSRGLGVGIQGGAVCLRQLLHLLMNQIIYVDEIVEVVMTTNTNLRAVNLCEVESKHTNIPKKVCRAILSQ